MPLGPMRTKAQKQEGVHTVMGEYKRGQLHSGSKTGPVVKSRAQAIAIALKQTGQSKYQEGGAATGYDPAPGQVGAPIGGSGFPSDPGQISQLNAMGNLPAQQQPAAIAQYYGYDPGTMQQVGSLFQQPQSNNPNSGDIGQPIPGGGGPSGLAMSPWQAARNGSMGFGIDGGVGGMGAAMQAPSPGMPGYNPGTYLGYPTTNYDKSPMSGLYPPGVVPPWLIAQIPQMLAAKSRGEYAPYQGREFPTQYFDKYGGSYIPPATGGGNMQAMWFSGVRAPATLGDTSGSMGSWSHDRWGRMDAPMPYTSARGGRINKYARGGSPLGSLPLGKMRPLHWKGFRHLDKGGFINSDVPGRTDKHYVTVRSGSYVLPADHVSALGQNNSVAGARVVRDMFAPGSRFGPRLSIPKFAGGGSVEPVPIVVAGGEVILPPDVVRRIGGGDMAKGHATLDKWVLATRDKHISKLKSLKPPKGS